MRLEMGTFPVHDLAFGAATRYDAGRLTVNRDAVLAAFRGGARGVNLSRRYSEMRLENLAGVKMALRELGHG